MRLSTLIFLFIAVSYSLYAQSSAHFGAPKFAPADGKKLLIVGQDLGAVGGLTNYRDGYIENINCPTPAGVTTYTSIPSLNGLRSFANWGSGDVQAQQYVQDGTFINSSISIGLYIVNQESAIAAGNHDAAIRSLARWCKDQFRPIFLRIGYEFEGPWNSYNPTQFKAAWKQIVHVFDDEDVRNVAYVWQSAGLNYSNIRNWYPGDEYVNWVGYSYFDGFDMGRSIRDFAEAHDKPIMISEATPRRDLKLGDGEGHWRVWYKKLFETIHDNDRIKILAYINVNWDAQSQWQGQGWGDSRLHVNQFVQDSWEAEMKTEPWLMASDTLFNLLQLQTWIDSVATSVENLDFSKHLELTQMNELIRITSTDNEKITDIFVHDFTGQRLFENKESNVFFEIPTTRFPKGGIIVSCSKNGQKFAKKVMIFQ